MLKLGSLVGCICLVGVSALPFCACSVPDQALGTELADGGDGSTGHPPPPAADAGHKDAAVHLADAAEAASMSEAGTDSMGPNPACYFGASYNGTASFTWYYFGQGTGQQGGYYITACGYQGTESGGGQSASDTVLDIAGGGAAMNTYFAAIPSNSSTDFNTVDDCGACVEITNGSTTIVATIIDACPEDTNPLCRDVGHLDLSTQAFNALNYPVGDPSGTTWRFIACPVSGNIQARLKSGNTDQLFLDNGVFPVVTVTAGGQSATHLSYGAWQLPNGTNADGATVTLTDVEGHMVTGTVPSGGGDLGVQFPSPGVCP